MQTFWTWVFRLAVMIALAYLCYQSSRIATYARWTNRSVESLR